MMCEQLTDKQTKLSSKVVVLRVFLILWTAVEWVMTWLEFFRISKYAVPDFMPAGYAFLLATFVYFKESDRWEGRQWVDKKGHFFVYIWWATMLAMIAIQFLTHNTYVVTWHMIQAFSYVTILLIIGDRSKRLHISKKLEQESSR